MLLEQGRVRHKMGQPLAGCEGPRRERVCTAMVWLTSALMYSRAVLEFQRPRAWISTSVAPLEAAVVAAPILKEWLEYVCALWTPMLASSFFIWLLRCLAVKGPRRVVQKKRAELGPSDWGRTPRNSLIAVTGQEMPCWVGKQTC